MVIGDYMSKTEGKKPSISTVKIQIINNQNLDLYWPLEVIESTLF
jgi:hypothetical protein